MAACIASLILLTSSLGVDSCGLLLRLQPRESLDDRPRRAQPIYGRADDAPRVARPLAHGVQPHDARRLAPRVVAQNAYRGTASCLGANECGIAQETPLPAPVQDRQPVV